MLKKKKRQQRETMDFWQRMTALIKKSTPGGVRLEMSKAEFEEAVARYRYEDDAIGSYVRHLRGKGMAIEDIRDYLEETPFHEIITWYRLNSLQEPPSGFSGLISHASNL